MSIMKLIIVGSRYSEESKLLEQESLRQGWQVKVIPIKDVIFKNGLPKLGVFDAILFRAINQHIIPAKIIAKYAKNQGKVIIDELLAESDYDFNKSQMHAKLSFNQVPQPKTYQVFSLANLKLVLNLLSVPLMVKPVQSMRGKGIFRFDCKKDCFNFFKQNRNYNYLIQEWLSSKYYYRVFVINNKVLGAIKRLSLKCNNRPRIPLEQRSKKVILSSNLKNLALSASRACNIEIAGIDIMAKNKKFYVLEVNRAPRFIRFAQVTKFNPAKEIINYLHRKIMRQPAELAGK